MPEKKPDFDLLSPEIVAEGVTPDAAIEFWKQRAKLTDEEAKALADGAKQRAFYVTGLAKHDLVQLVSNSIEQALENGETLPQFKGRILKAIEAQGWHNRRVELIFRTNMQTAYAAGRWKKIQSVKASRPYLQYVARMVRTRPSHAVLHNLVYPVDHEFWDHNYPPNGFRCHCHTVSLSARQVEKQGLTVQKEMPGPGVWTDPKTGMEHFVHFPGADKGFRNNPGKDWTDGKIDAALQGKALPPGWDYEKLRKPAYQEELGKIVKCAQKTNPEHHTTNCTRCFAAYELIRRGKKVEALTNPYPDRNGTSRRRNFSGKECFVKPLVYGYGERGGMIKTRRDLIRSMNFLPNGARAAVYWVAPGGKKGHIIAVEKVDGQIVFVDPQSGAVGPKALGIADRDNGYFWFRTDNLELDKNFELDEIVKEVKND